MQTLIINAPPTASAGVPFSVPVILTGAPASIPVTFTLSHLAGPGAPHFAPSVLVGSTDAAGTALVLFQGVALTSLGVQGLYCDTSSPSAGGFIASAADSLEVL